MYTRIYCYDGYIRELFDRAADAVYDARRTAKRCLQADESALHRGDGQQWTAEISRGRDGEQDAGPS